MKKTNLLLSTFVFLSAIIFANLAAAQSTPASAAEFYKCMSLNIGIENTTWGMFVSKSIPEEVSSQMTVDQIATLSTTQKEIEKIVIDVAQQNVARFVRNTTTSLVLKTDYNINTEFAHALRLFSRHLRMRLHKLKSNSWTKPISFQIVFAPRVSETLLDRRTDGLVPRLSVYPKDRFLVMEQMPDSDSIPRSFSEELEKLTNSGINLLAHKALTCGSSNPYLVSTVISLTVNPDIDKSGFKAQLVVGMPMGITKPFEQANDQIRFTTIVMPDKVDDTKSQAGYASTSQFPMAFVNLTGDLSSSQIPLLVRFGTISSFNQNGWERSDINILRTQVPRLRGTPAGKIKDLLSVDFSIFNIAAVIDYSKYQTNDVLEIKDLNLYISAGLNALAEFKVGMINKKEIDDQFKSEINKTTKATIEQQTQDLKKRSLVLVSENSQMQPAEVESLLKSIFTTTKSAINK